MNDFKLVSILKELSPTFRKGDKKISGISRLENESGTCTFSLSLINLSGKQNGEYFAYVFLPKQSVLTFNLGCSPLSFTAEIEKTLDLSNIAVGLIYVENFIPEMVAFFTNNEKSLPLATCKKIVANKCLLNKQENADTPLEEDVYFPGSPSIPCPSTPVAPYIPKVNPNGEPSTPTEEPYNDEVVVTENYFDKDFSLEKNLSIIKRWDLNYDSTKNDEPCCECQEKTIENGKEFNGVQNETPIFNGEKHNDKTPYFLTVKKDLEDLFFKFEKEENLERIIFNSKFVKINYSENKYYVVGVIYEQGVEKYICYGVPSPYSETPPKELDGFCSFIPLSIFAVKGDGYFMMFQDAITGECVKK